MGVRRLAAVLKFGLLFWLDTSKLAMRVSEMTANQMTAVDHGAEVPTEEANTGKWIDQLRVSHHP